MYGYALADVDLQPAWWKDDGTEIEAYALKYVLDKKDKSSSGLLITLLNHASCAEDIKLSFDASKAGIDTKEPLYVWYLDTVPFEKLKENGPGNSLFTIKDAREQSRITNGRVEISLKNVEPGVTKQIYVSNIPCLIHAISGVPTQIKAAQILGTSINLKPGRGKGTFLDIVCQRPSSILYILPQNKKSTKVIIDEKETSFQVHPVGGTQAILFDVPAGTHSILIQ